MVSVVLLGLTVAKLGIKFRFSMLCQLKNSNVIEIGEHSKALILNSQHFGTMRIHRDGNGRLLGQ